MAQYIEMKQLPGNTVTAKDDRILYDVNLKSGIIRGCEISYTGNNMIHINAGYGIIKGGLFEMEDHTEYVEYAEESTALGQIYLHFDQAAEDKLTIICETASSLTPLEQDEDANFTDGIYEMQMCTYTATTTALQDVVQTFPAAEGSVDVLDSLIEIAANTSSGKAAGALAVKSLNSNLTANNLPFRFGYDSETQQYGYILPDGEGGADTVHPFSSSASGTIVGTGGNVDIILPFKPKYVAIIVGTNSTPIICIYNEDNNNAKYNYASNTSSSVMRSLPDNASNLLRSINNDGFSITKLSSRCRYFATR